MRTTCGLMALAFFVACGCSEQSSPPPKSPSISAPSAAPVAPPESANTGENSAAGTDKSESTPAATADPAPAAETALVPVPVSAGVVPLNPQNTKITFVGTHAPPKAPDPRTGVFMVFAGAAAVEGKSLKSLTIDIDTKSIATQFENLTAHLKQADFFDANEYPSAKFVSTSITAGEGSLVTVNGNLTLLATTKEISFPATVNITDEGLTLKAEFTIDRTEFGMDKLTDGVEKPVKLTATIGEKTEAPAPAGPPAGGKRGK
jgi:polyisoprenoid-binding protein YceI